MCLFVSVFWFVAPLPAASFLTTTEYTLILSSPWWRPLAFLFFLSSPHILDYFYPLLEDRAWISHFCSSSACYCPWQVTCVLIIILTFMESLTHFSFLSHHFLLNSHNLLLSLSDRFKIWVTGSLSYFSSKGQSQDSNFMCVYFFKIEV